jgi:hypothetical protein
MCVLIADNVHAGTRSLVTDRGLEGYRVVTAVPLTTDQSGCLFRANPQRPLASRAVRTHRSCVAVTAARRPPPRRGRARPLSAISCQEYPLHAADVRPRRVAEASVVCHVIALTRDHSQCRPPQSQHFPRHAPRVRAAIPAIFAEVGAPGKTRAQLPCRTSGAPILVPSYRNNAPKNVVASSRCTVA